jgi:hypothetical protein
MVVVVGVVPLAAVENLEGDDAVDVVGADTFPSVMERPPGFLSNFLLALIFWFFFLPPLG